MLSVHCKFNQVCVWCWLFISLNITSHWNKFGVIAHFLAFTGTWQRFKNGPYWFRSLWWASVQCVCVRTCVCVCMLMHLFTLEVLAKSGDPILTALGTPCNLAILLQIIKTMIGFNKHTKFIYFYTPVTKLGLSWNRLSVFPSVTP